VALADRTRSRATLKVKSSYYTDSGVKRLALRSSLAFVEVESRIRRPRCRHCPPHPFQQQIFDPFFETALAQPSEVPFAWPSVSGVP